MCREGLCLQDPMDQMQWHKILWTKINGTVPLMAPKCYSFRIHHLSFIFFLSSLPANSTFKHTTTHFLFSRISPPLLLLSLLSFPPCSFFRHPFRATTAVFTTTHCGVSYHSMSTKYVIFFISSFIFIGSLNMNFLLCIFFLVFYAEMGY
jgi:hypothetical protein